MRFPLAVVAPLAAALLAPVAALAQQHIVLAHSQQVLTPSFALGSSLPLELGFWADEGLDVEVVTTKGASDAIRLVVAGQADVALANPTSAMAAIQRGADLKIIYTSTRGDIFGLALPEGMEIGDLKGKTVGVSSFASGGAAYAEALLRDAGLEPGTDVDLIEIGTGGRAAAAYEAGEVQALSLWDQQYTLLAERGIVFPTVIKDPRAQNFIAGSLIVRTEDLEKNRDAMIGLARGIAEAQFFKTRFPEKTIEIHWKVYPNSAPREKSGDALASAKRVLSTRDAIQSKGTYGTGRFGDVPMEQFADFQDYLVLIGELPKAVDPSVYLSNDLVDEINDFDEEAILAMGKETD